MPIDKTTTSDLDIRYIEAFVQYLHKNTQGCKGVEGKHAFGTIYRKFDIPIYPNFRYDTQH